MIIENINDISIETEVKDSYLAYAMSVIVSRAIPDVRDGLKPVHRRVLYSMYKSGFDYNKPHRKTARVVGDVMGKYHPHADSAIYDALVRMGQDFSLRVPLIDGQGNFGSVDGDPPASIRYTEARLAKPAHILLAEIEEDTVDFRDNYDGNEKEPSVLPAAFPNILINGTSGVAVGMSTNIPSHNPTEILEACIACLDDPDIGDNEIMSIVLGPDFPTAGMIIGRAGIRQLFETGKGTIVIRGKTKIEKNSSGKQAIVIESIPYQVNKSKLVEKIAELVKLKKIEGISDIRDESNKNGMRVVIDLKKDVQSDMILKLLIANTQLQVNFSAHFLLLADNKPRQLSLREILFCFLDFRKNVLTRQTQFRLQKAREKAVNILGIYIALLDIDKIIEIIKSSRDNAEASERLSEYEWHVKEDEVANAINLVANDKIAVIGGTYRLNQVQIKSILEIKLSKLTKLEKDKLYIEIKGLHDLISSLNELLSSPEKMSELIKLKLQEALSCVKSKRLTEIAEDEENYDLEDLIPREDFVVTMTMNGYAKRSKISNYRAQNRGGKGKLAQNSKSEDAITTVFTANNHDFVLFFSNQGKVYRLKVYKLPLGEPNSKGKALVNILPLAEGESISNIVLMTNEVEKSDDYSFVFSTQLGQIRRNGADCFSYIPSNGKIAIMLDPEDKLVSVVFAKNSDCVLLSTNKGKTIKFSIEELRLFKSRKSDGVRGMKIDPNKGEKVISVATVSGIDAKLTSEMKESYLGISVKLRIENSKSPTPSNLNQFAAQTGLVESQIKELLEEENFLLSVTENGYGKLTSSYEYPTNKRGGMGVNDINTEKRNGQVVASFPVNFSDEIMIVTSVGRLIRLKTDTIRITGRNAKGVRLVTMGNDEKIVSATMVVRSDFDEEEVGGNFDDGNETMSFMNE